MLYLDGVFRNLLRSLSKVEAPATPHHLSTSPAPQTLEATRIITTSLPPLSKSQRLGSTSVCWTVLGSAGSVHSQVSLCPLKVLNLELSTLPGCMLFSGLVLLISVFIPPEETSLLVMVSMVGKLAITSAYGTVYIFSTELFPTR